MQVSIEQQSDKSSLDSVELEQLKDCECDKGFGSMSSSERIQKQQQQQQQQQHESQQKEEVNELHQEVAKLKCDKLDLLRQNVVSYCRITIFLYLIS